MTGAQREGPAFAPRRPVMGRGRGAAAGWCSLHMLAMFAAAACQEVPATYDTAHAAGTLVFSEDFRGDQLDRRWHPSGAVPRIEGGRLIVEDARNHPIWLDVALPSDVRVELDAWALTDEGDIKLELFGDGVSRATSPSYVASGYVLIFGGWNNTTHAIVRRDEHGAAGVRSRGSAVIADRRYHFEIIRRNGHIAWFVDGTLLLEYDDPEPLAGAGQDRLALSGWTSPVAFDALRIEALIPLSRADGGAR